MNPSKMPYVVLLLSALLPGSSARAAELIVTPTVPLIAAPPGSSVLVDAVIFNPSTEVVFLTDVSSDAGELFATGNLFDEFQVARPDSLLPGESWEGPLVRLTVAVDAPVGSTHEVTVSFSGGDHAADIQSLASFTFALNDEAIVSGVPGELPATPPPVAGILKATPNPTFGSTELGFTLGAPGQVTINVYDVQGRAVRTLVDEVRGAGPQSVVWDGRDDGGSQVRTGVYFLRMHSQDGVRKTKVIRIAGGH